MLDKDILVLREKIKLNKKRIEVALNNSKNNAPTGTSMDKLLPLNFSEEGRWNLMRDYNIQLKHALEFNLVDKKLIDSMLDPDFNQFSHLLTNRAERFGNASFPHPSKYTKNYTKQDKKLFKWDRRDDGQHSLEGSKLGKINYLVKNPIPSLEMAVDLDTNSLFVGKLLNRNMASNSITTPTLNTYVKRWDVVSEYCIGLFFGGSFLFLLIYFLC